MANWGPRCAAVVSAAALLVGCTTAERQEAGPTTEPTATQPWRAPESVCATYSERVDVLFDDDESMLKGKDVIQANPATVRIGTETRQQALERFRYMFENQPDISRLARVEAMPASLYVVVRPGTDRQELAQRLRADLIGVEDVQADPCTPRYPIPTS
ncbi:permease-like cell division protein FtsX [Actinokineospora diospyrosa]|uniref:FtsX extracellular domain-containing protein n=1 Tax=Actinokineospora diospyrosa TaxID=103728 RepID=A0ABT1IAW4_9PSEU|nr:permease-like cell division protein FtsX [Actinokineospora diospyrosa]MCP2269780.1 hypothetical protein [Actinokineospora diospyrosa]